MAKPRLGAFRLYQFVKTDYEKAYRQMSFTALLTELALNIESTRQLNEEPKK
ncbi:hypothetical protein D3C77_712910 [compost metagenome]